MTLDEIEGVLTAALKMRSPVRDPDASGRAHIEKLENYLLESAQINGSLVEARHWLRRLEAHLAEEWAAMQGWEQFTTKPRAKLSGKDVQDAKIRCAPERYAAGVKARQLRSSVDDQISRFEREERVMSRAYTMATGG